MSELGKANKSRRLLHMSGCRYTQRYSITALIAHMHVCLLSHCSGPHYKYRYLIPWSNVHSSNDMLSWTQDYLLSLPVSMRSVDYDLPHRNQLLQYRNKQNSRKHLFASAAALQLRPVRKSQYQRHSFTCKTHAGSDEWRQYSRYLRYQKASDDRGVKVSWARYHLSVLFVDRTDTVRARVAAGLFDRIANWNGFGRALYPSTAGMHASGESASMTTSAGLMSQAGLLKIPPKLFSKPSQQFEIEDFDRNDILLAVDEETGRQLRDVLCEGVPDCRETLTKVALLTDFKDYLRPYQLLRTGGSAILEPELGQIVKPVVDQAQQAVGIKRPTLTGGSEEWNEMVQNLICSSAGLVQFLIDAWPPDLPEYDPL